MKRECILLIFLFLKRVTLKWTLSLRLRIRLDRIRHVCLHSLNRSVPSYYSLMIYSDLSRSLIYFLKVTECFLFISSKHSINFSSKMCLQYVRDIESALSYLYITYISLFISIARNMYVFHIFVCLYIYI